VLVEGNDTLDNFSLFLFYTTLLPYPLSLIHTLSHSYTFILSHILSYTLSHSYSHSYPYSLILTFTHILLLSFSPTIFYSHSLTFSLSYMRNILGTSSKRKKGSLKMKSQFSCKNMSSLLSFLVLRLYLLQNDFKF
jgi:hypothetical protein